MPQCPFHLTFLILGFCRALPSWQSMAALSGPKYLRTASGNQYLCHALLQLINMDKDAMRWKQDVLFNQVLGLFYWPQYFGSVYKTFTLSSTLFQLAHLFSLHETPAHPSEFQSQFISMNRSGS